MCLQNKKKPSIIFYLHFGYWTMKQDEFAVFQAVSLEEDDVLSMTLALGRSNEISRRSE